MGQRGIEAQRLVGAPGVVELAEGVDLGLQCERIADLDPVQVLVLERLVPALDDPVRLRRVMPGPDVAQFGTLSTTWSFSSGVRNGLRPILPVLLGCPHRITV